MALHTVDVRLTPCPNDCGELVRVVTAAGSNREVRLDPEPSHGGLYRIDDRGRAARRSLVELYRAQRDRRGFGFDVHACPPPRSWVDRD